MLDRNPSNSRSDWLTGDRSRAPPDLGITIPTGPSVLRASSFSSAHHNLTFFAQFLISNFTNSLKPHLQGAPAPPNASIMTSTPPSPPRTANPPVSTTSSSFNPSAQAPAAKPAAPPVSILPSQIAQAYSLAHPAVLLVVLVVRFRALVKDPVAELLNDLPFLALLQVGYVMVCLPPAGSVVAPPPSSSSSAGASAGASEASSDGDEKKRPSSGAGTGTVVRPGRVGYRRKHHAKSDSAGLAAKLVVCQCSGSAGIGMDCITK